jgi:diguanylate cyclase (GGDEF)-like protein
MRLVSRHDIVLLAGLAIALFVLLSGPLGHALDVAHALDESSGLQLLPALVILAAVFVFHQQRKRHEAWAEAVAATSDAKQADARATEMERLVSFGQTLARALDYEAIRAAATEHLPTLLPGRGIWALARQGSHWEPLAVTGASTPQERERAACEALGEPVPGIHVGAGDVAFPMVAGDEPVGVLGVSAEPELTEAQRGVLSAAAAMLAVSLKNAVLFREVRENSVRDALTGCVNRKHALEVIDAEVRRARRSKLPLCLLMFDLDHFKQVNDRRGHLCGDAVLAKVGQRMNAVLRGSDLKCRYGGEEFLVLLPDTPLAGAERVAETLRSELESHPVNWNEELVGATASFGVTEVLPGEVDVLAVIARADEALYRAKQDGRNCVRVHQQPVTFGSTLGAAIDLHVLNRTSNLIV